MTSIRERIRLAAESDTPATPPPPARERPAVLAPCRWATAGPSLDGRPCRRRWRCGNEVIGGGTPQDGWTEAQCVQGCRYREKLLVSLVIASRDEGDAIRHTVRSAWAAATDRHDFEVIVVDDGSADGSCHALCGDPGEVRVVRHERPQGAGMSRHDGLMAARGAVVVVCDAHMVFPPAAWERLAAQALSTGGIVCAAMRGVGEDIVRAGANLRWHPDGKIGIEWAREDAHGGLGARTAVLGACYALPRSVWHKLRHWPSCQGLWGYEEPALSAWAWLHGVPIHADSGVVVQHQFRKGADIPWGQPLASDVQVNISTAHLELFSATTYDAVWREALTHKLSQIDQLKVWEAERREGEQSSHWKDGRTRTDYEFFREVLKVPAVAGPGGSVERVCGVSVIVTARNEGAEVLKTVASLVNSGQSDFEVVVVDDASEDGSVSPDFVEHLRPKVRRHWRAGLADRIQVIRHEEALGVSRSRAEAIRQARGEVLCIYDAHQRMRTPYGVEVLATAAQDRAALVLPSVQGLGGEGPVTYGAHFRFDPKWGLMNGHEREATDGLARRQAVIGCGYTIRRDVLARLGGWPELPGVWSYNEQWLGVRAWFLGVPVYVHGGVRAEHLYKKSFNYAISDRDPILNGHLFCYVHFSDEAYRDVWCPRLRVSARHDEVEAYLASAEVQALRADWQARPKVHTESEFLALCTPDGK